MSRNPNLPARPNFIAVESAAGPSRPPSTRRTPGQTRAPAAAPSHYTPQPFVPQAYAQAAPNLSGGYQPAGGYPWASCSAYGYGQAYVPQSYGQALFSSAQPHVNAQGYAYSQTYHAGAQAQPAALQQHAGAPAAKRFRPNPPSTAAVTGTGGTWRNCSVSGCKFVGAEQDVVIHEGDRHLLFPNGKPVERSEEEERAAKRKGPVFIEGTGITLQTDEDIAKWIAERKAKWPSAKRQAEKAEEEKAAIARGELPGRGGRGGRGRGGMSARRLNDPAARAEDWGRPVPEESDFGPSGMRGGPRGRGRDGRVHEGRGRGTGRGRGGLPARPNPRELPVDQQASGSTSTQPASTPEGQDAVAKPDAGGIVAGLDGYASGSASDASSSSDSSESSSSESDSDESDESDSENDEAATGGRKDGETGRSPTKAQAPSKPVCRFFAKNGKCRFGDKCQYSHDIVPERPDESAQPQVDRKPVPKQPPRKKPNPFARPSMLGALLANPIQNTLSQLTQTIRFLVANDMLRGVEVRPGQAEEEERERTKIAVVHDETGHEPAVEDPVGIARPSAGIVDDQAEVAPLE